jgi:hypothetical protein
LDSVLGEEDIRKVLIVAGIVPDENPKLICENGNEIEPQSDDRFGSRQ